MALNMDAIMRFTAKVVGTEQLNKLGTQFKGLQSAAMGLTKAGGLLGGALGSLAPLASVAGLTALVSKTVDAADKMHGLSLRTGVTVENLGKLNKAAKLSGVDIDVVSGALGRLSKAMVASVSSSRFSEMTKEEADQAVRAVRDAEKAQTRIINDQADQRINALERETDRRLGEISKRYRRENQITQDNFDDAADKAQQAAEDATEKQLKQISRFYDGRRKLIRDDQALTDQAKEYYLQVLGDQEDEATDRVRDAAAEQMKARQRADRDRLQNVMDYMQSEEDKEKDALKRKLEEQKKTIKEGTDYQIEQIGIASQAQQEAFKKSVGVDDLSQQMEEMGLSGKAASEVFAKLGVSVRDAGGQMRNPYNVMIDLFDALNNVGDAATRNAYIMQVFGRSGMQMGEMISMGGSAIDKFKASIDTAFAAMADKYKDQLITLGGAVGKIGVEITGLLLPALVEITPYLVGFVKGISDLPGPAKTALLVLSSLAVALTSLSFLLVPLILLFTGPAGIVVAIGAAVVAVGALAFTFRDKLGVLPAFVWGVIDGINKNVQSGIKAVSGMILGLVDGINKTIRQGITATWDWLKGRFDVFSGWIQSLADGAVQILSGIAGAIQNAFMAIPNMLRSAINAALAWAGNAVNGLIGVVNGFIQNANRLANAVRLPGLPLVPTVPIPQFATGAYVTGATTAELGEGGQPEYVIPADRMAAASTAYLQGARGIGVVNGQAPGGGGRSITVNTGPIMQQPDGSRWVSLDDLERGIASAVDQAVGIVASPAGRMALGGA